MSRGRNRAQFRSEWPSIAARRNGAMRVRLETAGRDAALELWGAERKSDLWEKCFETDLEFEIGR